MLTKDTVLKYSHLCASKDRIVILSDSLSMPRPDETIFYEETYPFLLEKALLGKYEIVNRGKRTNTILEQIKDQYIFDDMIFLYPKFAVIQLGIVDCAPRLFSKKFGIYVIDKIRPAWLKKFVIGQFSSRRLFLTKHFPKQYVSLDEFSRSYDYLLEVAVGSGIMPIVVNIARTSTENDRRSYRFNQIIREYNSVIAEIAQRYRIPLIDMFEVSERESVLLEDGIHYNLLGSQIVARELAQRVLDTYPSNSQ